MSNQEDAELRAVIDRYTDYLQCGEWHIHDNISEGEFETPLPHDFDEDKLYTFLKARDEQREREIEKVTRFEVIDHRECVWCRGRKTSLYAQKDGRYKELPCDKCDGTGISGGRVYSAWSVNVELNYQDEGRTLKVFVSDPARSKEEE